MATTPNRNSLDSSGERQKKRIWIIVFSLAVVVFLGGLLLLFIIPLINTPNSSRGTSNKYIVVTLPGAMRAEYITMDHNGTMWFADRSYNKIGKIVLDQKQVTEYAVPNVSTDINALWFFITIGPDGNPWFTFHEQQGFTLATITSTGKITQYPITSNINEIGGITLGPDGNFWITASSNAGYIVGKVNPTGHMTEYPLPSKTAGFGSITSCPDGNLWFTESIAKIGRITPAGSITEFALEKDIEPRDITSGPDGNIWFTTSINKIGKITPDGKKVTTYVLPRKESNPENLIAGPDGNLWFTELDPGGDKIGRITPNGVITEYYEAYGDFSYTGLTISGNSIFFAVSYGTLPWYRPPSKIGRIPILS